MGHLRIFCLFSLSLLHFSSIFPVANAQLGPLGGPIGGGVPLGGGGPAGVPIGAGGPQGQNVGPQGSQLFTGVGDNVFYGVNLVPFGTDYGDHKVHPGFLTAGQTIDLYMYFPFYGGLYNYTTLSVNGYMAFATVLDQGPTINVGPEATDWPRQQDPAMIAPYLCKQQIPQDSNVVMGSAGVYYRLIMRQSMFGRGSGSNINPDMGGTMPESSYFGFRFQKCPAAADNYVRCDAAGDYFLDQMMRWLQDHSRDEYMEETTTDDDNQQQEGTSAKRKQKPKK